MRDFPHLPSYTYAQWKLSYLPLQYKTIKDEWENAKKVPLKFTGWKVLKNSLKILMEVSG